MSSPTEKLRSAAWKERIRQGPTSSNSPPEKVPNRAVLTLFRACLAELCVKLFPQKANSFKGKKARHECPSLSVQAGKPRKMGESQTR